MAEIEIRTIRKAFDGGKIVLDDVSFKAADGEFVSLLGASGCGKSTLLRIIAGLEFSDYGHVRIDGKDVTRKSPKDRDIAMVFQNYALYPHLDVAENIGMGLKLRNVGVTQIKKRVGEVAKMLGLSELLGRKPSALSGGQRQRVALARAIVRQPKAFLLDEPLSNLDAVLRERTRGELKLLFRRIKGTVIYVTHDQIEAMTMSDRIVVLDAGRIQQVGTPDEIYNRPANTFVATFLGSPPMNLLPEEKAAAAGLVESGKTGVLLGVRPEDVEVSAEVGAGLREATVTLAEPTGASTVLSLECGASLRALVRGNWDVGRQKAWVRFPQDRLHRFDAATRERLGA